MILSLPVALLPQPNPQNQAVPRRAAFRGGDDIVQGGFLTQTWLGHIPSQHRHCGAPTSPTLPAPQSFVPEGSCLQSTGRSCQWAESCCPAYCVFVTTLKGTWCAVDTGIYILWTVLTQHRGTISLTAETITQEDASVPSVTAHAI